MGGWNLQMGSLSVRWDWSGFARSFLLQDCLRSSDRRSVGSIWMGFPQYRTFGRSRNLVVGLFLFTPGCAGYCFFFVRLGD